MPNTASEFILNVVPLATFLLGVAFVLFPRQMLRLFGLQANAIKYEAKMAARSDFAAPYIAAGLGCLLLQDPLAPQASLVFVLILGWLVSSIGRVLQMMLDQGLRKRVQLRLILALGLAVAVISVSEIPDAACVDPFSSQCLNAHRESDLLVGMLAAVTLIYGLVGLLFPRTMLHFLRLQPRPRAPFAAGETRGTLAGFYVSIGAGYLLFVQPVWPLLLVVPGLWVIGGAGRILSILIDRAWTKRDFALAIVQSSAGCLAAARVLGFV